MSRMHFKDCFRDKHVHCMKHTGHYGQFCQFFSTSDYCSHMWVEFFVGSRPCSERFFSLRVLQFPLSSKGTFPSSNSIWTQWTKSPPCRCATANSHFVLVFIYLLDRASRF